MDVHNIAQWHQQTLPGNLSSNIFYCFIFFSKPIQVNDSDSSAGSAPATKAKSTAKQSAAKGPAKRGKKASEKPSNTIEQAFKVQAEKSKPKKMSDIEEILDSDDSDVEEKLPTKRPTVDSDSSTGSSTSKTKSSKPPAKKVSS